MSEHTTIHQQSHDRHQADAGHDQHEGHSEHPAGHDKHAGHDPEMFRRKFWLSLRADHPDRAVQRDGDGLVRLQDRPGSAGSARCSAPSSSCTAGGRSWPAACRDPRPRAGHDAADLDGDHGRLRRLDGHQPRAVFDLDFWWELAALVTIMLLGHWQEMKAIGQAQGALAALAALLPDDAERVVDGRHRDGAGRRAAPWATSCWSAPARGSRPTGRSSTARPSWTSR